MSYEIGHADRTADALGIGQCGLLAGDITGCGNTAGYGVDETGGGADTLGVRVAV